MLHRLFFLLFFALITFTSRSQHSQFQNFSVEDGLPQSQIYALLVDSKQRVWIGTKGGGLCNFNGKNFTKFYSSNQLNEDKVFALCEDHNRIIWIGTQNGLFRYDGLTFQREEILGKTMTVSSIIEDDQARIWITSNLGVFVLNSGYWSQFKFKNNLFSTNVSCIFKDAKGVLWVGSDDGLAKIDGKKTLLFTKKEGLSSNKIRAINEVNGNLLVGTYGRGLNFLVNDQWHTLGNPKEIINSIFVDIDQNSWLSTYSNGIVKITIDDNSVESFTTDNGLSTNHTRQIVQDQWGHLWVGSSGGGLDKMFTPIFRHYNKKDGFEGNMFYAILEASDGSIWTSTSTQGIATMYKDSIVIRNGKSGFKNSKCKALFEDALGNIWIGTEGLGLYIYHDNSYYNIRGDDGLADNWIREFAQDDQGNIWVATVSGLSKVSLTFPPNDEPSYVITNFDKNNGMPDDRINCVKKDAFGKIWFGCQNGTLGYILNDQIVTYDKKDGLGSSPIKSIDFNTKNRIILATEGAGIFFGNLLDSFITFNSITSVDGLNSNNVYLIACDANDHIWAGAGSGVDEIILDETGGLLNCKHFGKNEGFLGGETCSNSVTVASDGKIWIGTLNGLNCYLAPEKTKNDLAPLLYLTNLTIFYQDISRTVYKNVISEWFEIKKPILFKANDNHLGFHFEGINLRNPDEIYYRFKLEGFDKTWSPKSKISSATYSNLPSGEYSFQVKSVNEDGVWSVPLSVSFSIAMPYYQTAWFIGSVIAVSALILFLVVFLIIRSFRKKTKEEREKLRIEKNLLELEQKALRLQMNPHFIFNAMNSVQALIAKNDTKEARYYLAKFSKLMRKVLENSRHTLISIQDEVEALENYLTLEKITAQDVFDFNIEIDPKMAPDALGIPPLLLQPFAENAIVHGIREIDYRGTIKICFLLYKDYIECSVQDNGRGRKAASEVRHQKSSYQKSTALLITQERLAQFENDGYIPFEIIDQENPRGTKVIVRIPKVEIY